MTTRTSSLFALSICATICAGIAARVLTPTQPRNLDADSPAGMSPNHPPGLAAGVSLACKPAPDAIFCFAQGTPVDYIAAIERMYPAGSSVAPAEGADPRYQFNDSSRWSGGQGNPRALSWSFVPDGMLADSQPSVLFAELDADFAGDRALWISRIASCFDRWAQLGGVTYTHVTAPGVDWDDGANWGSTGNGTTRGDVRIAMIPQDGANGVLAYNYFPNSSNGGDMVLDSSENWGQANNLHRFLRNVISHEHGHGLGFSHVCPAVHTKIMEPTLNLGFDGPRQDDIRVVQRGYGDIREPDNSAGQAFDLGPITPVTPIVDHCMVPPPLIGAQALIAATCSIDADGEEDYFKFIVAVPSTVTITLTPKGNTYDSVAGSASNCPSGGTIDAAAIANLNFQLIGTDGSTVLADVAVQPAGVAESLSDADLTGSPGTFYIRVDEDSVFSQSQLYTISVSVEDAFVDCNGNLVTDATDISNGTSLDCNSNFVPDDCEFPGCPGILSGDLDCSTAVDGLDVPRWVTVYVGSEYTCQADIDQDGDVDLVDADLLANLLIGP
jgi:hypothetical protein